MKNYEAPELLQYAFMLERDVMDVSDNQGGGGDVLPDDEFDD